MKKNLLIKYASKTVIIVVLIAILLGPNVNCTQIYQWEEDETGSGEWKFSCEATAINCLDDLDAMGCGDRITDQSENQGTDETKDVQRPDSHTSPAEEQPIEDFKPDNDPTNIPMPGEDAGDEGVRY